jgi:hypothetical protein
MGINTNAKPFHHSKLGFALRVVELASLWWRACLGHACQMAALPHWVAQACPCHNREELAKTMMARASSMNTPHTNIQWLIVEDYLRNPRLQHHPVLSSPKALVIFQSILRLNTSGIRVALVVDPDAMPMVKALNVVFVVKVLSLHALLGHHH